MKNLIHRVLSVVALGAIPVHSYAQTLMHDATVCDTVAEFALFDGRQHNHNDEPVAGCRDVPVQSIRVVHTDVPGGSYAIIAKVRVGSRVGFGDQAYIQVAKSHHVAQ